MIQVVEQPSCSVKRFAAALMNVIVRLDALRDAPVDDRRGTFLRIGEEKSAGKLSFLNESCLS